MNPFKRQVRRLLEGAVGGWVLASTGAALGMIVFLLVLLIEQPAPPPVKKSTAPVPANRTPVRAAPVVAGLPEKPRATLPKLPASEAVAEAASERAEVPVTWQRFAVAHRPVGNRPMIAVIIDDMGLDQTRSAQAIDLKGPLTVSFLSYAKDLKSQAAAAREAGHELMVHVPMEPMNGAADPGRNVIGTDQTADEARRRLDWALSRFDRFVGINNHMGSRYTADAAGMTLVLKEVKRRGLLFVDSRTTPDTVARRLSRKLSVPFAERDVFVDDDPRPNAILRQLDAVVRAARKNKYAIAIGHPRDATLAALKKWLPTLSLRGLALVPVSAIVKYRMNAD